MKVLLYVAAEDEAFTALYREMDIQSLSKERISVSVPSDSPEWESVEKMPLGGRNIEQWMRELDTIAKEVEVELISRDIGCHLVEVLEAVNQVLFGVRGYKRNPVLVDSKCSYLHSVLSSRCGSGNKTRESNHVSIFYSCSDHILKKTHIESSWWQQF